METCLLCLEFNKNTLDCIAVNSSQWCELNITNLIGKHLWPMATVEASKWLCTACWRKLYEFHKFYIRIEKAHLDFGLINLNEDYQSDDNDHNSIKSSLCSEFVMHGSSFLEKEIEEQKTIIKEESNKEQSIEDIPLNQRRKRGRRRKDVCNDPLNKSKRTKQLKDNIANQLKQSVQKSISPIEQSNDRVSLEISEIKIEPDLPIVLEEHRISFSTENNDIDTDSNLDKGRGEKDSLAISERKLKTDPHKIDEFIAENFKISCILCQIPIETFQAMRKHFEVQHKQRGYVTCCNKKFYRRSILVDHVNLHLDPNYFKCNECNKVMAARRCLELHIKSHEGKPEKNHCCDICDKKFSNPTVLKRHKLIHLSEEEKRFPCSECGKNFGNNYVLSNHYRVVHLNKYAKICDICGKSIRCKEVFERHMLEHKGKTAPSISCDICGLLLTDKWGLKLHKDRIHPASGKQEYTCAICSKVSPNLRAHKGHIQYKHKMGYDHKCTICEKAFKRAKTLLEHMATHTGTVLYTCPWCPKTFKSNANMHNHRKKAHPKEWEEAARKRYSSQLLLN